MYWCVLASVLLPSCCRCCSGPTLLELLENNNPHLLEYYNSSSTCGSGTLKDFKLSNWWSDSNYNNLNNLRNTNYTYTNNNRYFNGKWNNEHTKNTSEIASAFSGGCPPFSSAT